MSTILVVDDMAICREPIAEALRQHGYDAICAADGSEALSLIRYQRPALVLLDVMMPGLDGLAVLRTIRRNPDLSAIPVVLLTDRAERDVVKEAAGYGVQGYLLKSGFSLEELISRVESSLGKVAVPTPAASEVMDTGARERYGSWRSTVEKAPATVAAPARPAATRGAAKQGSPTTETAKGGDHSTATDASAAHELVPVITKADLMRLVNDGLALRPLGPTVHDVIVVTGNTSCSAEDVAKAVSHDQALCIRLLKLANSTAYSRGRLVDSVKEAIQRIGVGEVRSLVMTLGVFEQFEGAAAKYVDCNLFWEHSIACGLMASALARARQASDVDNYFLWGMLHDVGRLILLEHASDQYATVWEGAERLDMPLESIEGRIMLLDHCNILERALEHWQFPRDFIAPVVNHHQSVAKIKRLGPAHMEAAATVALANRITHALLLGSSGNDVLYPLEELVETLKLAPASLAALTEQVADETNSLKFTMLARGNEAGWQDFAARIRKGLAGQWQPLCVSTQPETDAYRMFCERIVGRGNEEVPHVGVMYLRDASEQAALAAKYDQAESAAGAAGTPVIVICHKGHLDADDPWLRSRHHIVLKTPVRVSTFVSAVNDLLT